MRGEQSINIRIKPLSIVSCGCKAVWLHKVCVSFMFNVEDRCSLLILTVYVAAI